MSIHTESLKAHLEICQNLSNANKSSSSLELIGKISILKILIMQSEQEDILIGTVGKLFNQGA